MDYLDAAALTAPHLEEDDVELAGGRVRVRALNTAEAIKVENTAKGEARQRRIIALGMIRPRVTESTVGRMLANRAAGDGEKIARRIAELSGMVDGADREAYKSVRNESGSGDAVLPGEQAGDDGGGDEDPAVG